jgi:hypothetical protein
MELTCLSLDSDLVRGIDERRRRLRLAKDRSMRQVRLVGLLIYVVTLRSLYV